MNGATAFLSWQTLGRMRAMSSDHELYKTGDVDAPHQIKNHNNEVVLRLCRKCGRAESRLETHPCNNGDEYAPRGD